MPAPPRPAAILGGNRIPFARSNSTYFEASNTDMLAAALDGLVDRFDLKDERIGEVVAGAVLKHSRDFNLVREVVLGSELSPETPAYDIQQACGTGLEAAILVANKIALGQIESGIAGGVDTTSDAPIAVNDKMRRVLLEFNQQKDIKGRLRSLGKLRPNELFPDAPANREPRTGKSMGGHTAETAERYEDMCKVRTNRDSARCAAAALRPSATCLHASSPSFFLLLLFVYRKAHSIVHSFSANAARGRVFESAWHNPVSWD